MLKGTYHSNVLAIGHGGIVPAAIIARALQLPVSVLMVSSYGKGSLTDEMVQQTAPVISDFRSHATRQDHTLVIDDLVDSGATYRAVIDLLRGLAGTTFAVLYDKGLNTNALSVRTFSTDTWLVFPWETPPPSKL
jgi:hypoxanthine phosphoribosyltransferase